MSELAEVICGEQEGFARLAMKEMEQHKLRNSLITKHMGFVL
jgi:hypothetical protein